MIIQGECNEHLTPAAARLVAVLAEAGNDLLKPEFHDGPHPLYGHCYVAAEALYHHAGGRASVYTPVRARDHNGTVHWWLEDLRGNIIDPTASQYLELGQTPPYKSGRRAGFLTKQPSKRAQEVLDLMERAKPR